MAEPFILRRPRLYADEPRGATDQQMSKATKQLSGTFIPRRRAKIRVVSGPRLLLREALLIVVLFAMQLQGSIVSTSSFILLALWALTSSRNAAKALILSYLIVFLNPGIFDVSAYASLLRWLVLLAAASRIFCEFAWRGFRVKRWLLWFSSFCVIVAGTSVLFGNLPTVSSFKMLSFFAGFVTIFLAVQYSSRYDWLSWIFTVWSTVLFLSLPLLATELGYFRNGLGFQGILNQPQLYGIFFSVPTFYLTAKVLLREVARTPVLTVFLIGSWATLITTQSRTSLVAGSLALVFSVAWVAFRKIHAGQLRIRPVFKPAVVVLSGIALVVGIFYWSEIGEKTTGFILKPGLGGPAELGPPGHLSEDLLRRRVDTIGASWNNFVERPLTGIGFGVPSETYSSVVPGSEVFGISVEAPVEKSFMPTALLEETGLVGSTLFLVFLLVLVSPILRYGGVANTMLFFTALFVNVGEMVFFSVGGGVYFWLCMSLAREWSNVKNKEDGKDNMSRGSRK